MIDPKSLEDMFWEFEQATNKRWTQVDEVATRQLVRAFRENVMLAQSVKKFLNSLQEKITEEMRVIKNENRKLSKEMEDLKRSFSCTLTCFDTKMAALEKKLK